MQQLKKIGLNARKAFEELKIVKHSKIKKVLSDYNKILLKNKKKIIAENQKDIRNAKRKQLIDRLILDESRIENIRNSINQIEKFKNPVGRILDSWQRPNKLKIKKVSTPIGVIGVIYESRPNVTADVAALCLKSGNCSILRGGSEAINSNKILANLFRDALQKNNINKNCVQFIDNKDRKIVDNLLSKMSRYIDVIVPRGGKGLVSKVQKFSNIHVIGHLEGLCHIYIDKSISLRMAKKVILNSKMRRTSICGAVETLLIDQKAIKTHAKEIIESLIDSGCEVRVDGKINKLFKNKLKAAKEIDWRTEYLDSIISIKTVKNVHDGVNHILKYGTMHTDSILSKNFKNAKIFLHGVNSSIAMHNVSTQFADGGEFGFGGEVGISTNKLPPRGPVGINQLTSYKYIVSGKGIVRL
ncbi:MAG: glutamate-5-semialdehyde dehydrogenase [Candidatus Pelagibacter sp. TMED272]|nr:glutamate-5-semialdehyde dehydrogenase [Pelagibacteraceae bacterium]RPG93671.1 MAG: glutamate-5-semialdehyde dehydrogenase [Candidatus Pelagibacter sp. TMED272]|tara:strand:+ start:5361 stop:6602 length:1242 start_codon:yes stop_codon:yes gene_type:complete